MIELLMIPLSFFIDQSTKNKAEKHLLHSPIKKAWHDRLHLHIVYNEGAFLGFLKNHKTLLMLANGIAIAILLVTLFSYSFTKGFHLIKLGFSLIAGGAAGNIYDRVKKGRVVDFFAFSIKPNIYFNLADFFVFIGAFLVAIGGAISEVQK